jgi:hypothetical protein
VKAGPNLLRLRDYASRRLRLSGYLEKPGDGRTLPQIPAAALLWSLLASKILRISAFSATEQWLRQVPEAFGLCRSFGDDALGYFTERLDAQPLRAALQAVVHRAKRNKAFDQVARVGLAIDGTGLGKSQRRHCQLCHLSRNGSGEVVRHTHKAVGACVIAGDLALPLDLEFYGPGEGELTAGKRLLERVFRSSRIRFDYLVVDGLYSGSPFLHLSQRLGIPIVVRLKENLPELLGLAQARFREQPPTAVYTEKGERIEIWDADDFEPWQGLEWPDVRVIRYRQHRPNGEVCEAYWLTNFPHRKLGSLSLYHICKSRWQIENRVFNEGKTLYGLEHIPHHHPNAILIDALLTCLALCIERLYRLRHLRRAGRAPYAPVSLWRLLWLSLGAPPLLDTS